MDLNGKKVGMDNLNSLFSKMTALQGTMDIEEKVKSVNTKESNFLIKECNRIAEIPARYSENFFGDYDYGEVGRKVEEFALNPADRAFLLCGPTGVGKTTLQCASLHERAVRELPAGLYFNNRFLMPKLRTCRSYSARENEEAFLKRLITVPFLCIDEVGTVTNFTEEAEFMTLIVCGRYDNKLPTFICTNLDSLNFSLLLCGIDYRSASREANIETWKKIAPKNATLNRFNSIATKEFIDVESHRGNRNGK